MVFFTDRFGKNKTEERNSDEDDEDFHAIFEIKDLVSPDIDDEEDGHLVQVIAKTSEKQLSVQASETKPVEVNSDDLEIVAPDEFIEANTPGEVFVEGEMSKIKSAIVWNNKGVVLSRLGKYMQAIDAFNQALLIDPHYPSAWNNKGVTLSRLGKYSEALEAYDMALQVDQNYQGLYKNLMMIQSSVSTQI